MGNWHSIETQSDIDLLFDTYGGFHDSCIVSADFQSGAFVDGEMAMHFGGAKGHKLSVIFQRQWEPKTLELQFIGLRQLRLTGWQDNYLCDIVDAYLSFHVIFTCIILENGVQYRKQRKEGASASTPCVAMVS